MRESKTISEINNYVGYTINPLQYPEQIYELYSVPSFDNEYPEIIKGSEIGSSKVTIEEGDVLICKINPRINRVWVVKHNTDYPLIASSEWIVVRNRTLNPEYLKWYFSSPTFRTMLISQVAGIGGSLTRAQPKQVAGYSVPIPSSSEQESIVLSLNKISDLIALRKKQLQKLDDLVKARFVELFGHQSHNEKNMSYGKIDDVAEIYLGLTHTPTYVEDGVKFISAKNTSCDYLDLSDVKYISREEFEKAPKGTKPQIGDVLFSRVGSNLGHPVILDVAEELCTFVSLGFLRTKGTVTNVYLKHWMRDNFFAEQVAQKVVGGGQPNLNTGWLKEFKIIIPPMSLQNEFTAFVEQTDKSKLTIQQSLDKLELMKKALMQKYFE